MRLPATTFKRAMIPAVVMPNAPRPDSATAKKELCAVVMKYSAPRRPKSRQ
jgi:hypothetical protein